MSTRETRRNSNNHHRGGSSPHPTSSKEGPIHAMMAHSHSHSHSHSPPVRQSRHANPPAPTSVEAFMKSWKEISNNASAAPSSARRGGGGGGGGGGGLGATTDEWTLPTFVSVYDDDSDVVIARVGWGVGGAGGYDGDGTVHPSTPSAESSTRGGHETTMAAYDAMGVGRETSTMGGKHRRNSRLMQHMERLRWLTGRFVSASNAAIVVDAGGRRRSSQQRQGETMAISNAIATSAAMRVEVMNAIEVDKDDVDDADDAKEVNDVGEKDEGSMVEWALVDYVKKMASSCVCSLAMLFDEVDGTSHEGRIIGIPDNGGGKTNHGGIDFCRSRYSAVSSLSGDTLPRYQKRYYAEDVSDGTRYHET